MITQLSASESAGTQAEIASAESISSKSISSGSASADSASADSASPRNTASDSAASDSDLPIESLEDAIERCQSLGMRLSRQRKYILELLWQQQEHLSARAIYDQLNRKGREIGHTSVYQNLEALSEHGIIECVERSDGRLYGHSSSPHSHVICTETQKIMDIHISLPPEFLAEVEAKTGMEITDYRIDFFGRKPE